MEIRFALDIGVASVGWAVVNDTYEVLEAGLISFPVQIRLKTLLIGEDFVN